MNFNKTLTHSARAFVASLSFASVASADTEWHFQSNEAGWKSIPSHAAKSNVTRAKVQREARMANEFGKGTLSPDGWRYVGGERGWIYEGHIIEYRDGKWVHVDGIDKSAPRPSPKMTPKEKAAFDAIFTGG